MPHAVHNHTSCCHEPHAHQKSSLSDTLFRLLEKASAIALGIFSAQANLGLFLPYFGLGAAVGLYQHFTAEPRLEKDLAHSACAQGFLEQLTGVKLPPLLSLGANLAITWCHIDHHTSIFVPVVGLSLGAWAGQSAGELGSHLFPHKQHAVTA